MTLAGLLLRWQWFRANRRRLRGVKRRRLASWPLRLDVLEDRVVPSLTPHLLMDIPLS